MFSRAFAYRLPSRVTRTQSKIVQWPSLFSFSFSLSDFSNSEDIPARPAEEKRPELEVLLEPSIPGIAKSWTGFALVSKSATE